MKNPDNLKFVQFGLYGAFGFVLELSGVTKNLWATAALFIMFAINDFVSRYRGMVFGDWR